ncbi:MAG: hypothetical protein HJJLKODD_01719 [Phycisphaerae bacterium]|nr:hypothetical protein [Phycisphaerae bacterium]
MPQWPHLENAPIREALIDIRVELPPAANLDSLQPIRDSLREQYPNSRDRISLQYLARIFGDKAIESHTESQQVGYILESADKTQVVQVRLDGFTFSRLKPYQNWEQLKREARQQWQVYFNTLNPVRVVRVAVRYINELNFDLPVSDLGKWILTTPTIAPGLPNEMAGYFTKLMMEFKAEGCNAIITQSIDPGQVRESVPINFDIDVFKFHEYKPDSEDSERIWEDLEILHDVKNDIFFNSITEETKRKYQ